jgi:outer membrane protein assembly factor BamB
VTRDRALCVSGQPGAAHGALSGFDLFSGQQLFQRELNGGPLASPVVGDQVGIVSSAEGSGLSLRCFDLNGGSQRWQRDDPGLGEGGSPLIVDRHLVVNAPAGTATAIDLASGETQWQQRLADPVRDDVPRRLEPILRGGALFLPSASVHVVRPSDGVAIASPIAESIIPDFMRVDERGWLYLAEESGHVEAYAPAPSLRLVKG